MLPTQHPIKPEQIYLYIQTVAGMYPIGTVYARMLESFLATTVYNGRTVPKF